MLAEHGPNVLARDQRPGPLRLLWRSAINPLVILLAVLATVSFSTGDARAGTVMMLMIVLGVGLRLYQEAKADNAAAKLKAMISVTRDGAPRRQAARDRRWPQLVPGDVVQLAAGDMIPADVRIVAAKDLFVIQGSLTGESFPVEKFDDRERGRDAPPPLELTNIASWAPASRAARRRRSSSPPARTLTSAAWPSRCRAARRQTASIGASPGSPG